MINRIDVYKTLNKETNKNGDLNLFSHIITKLKKEEKETNKKGDLNLFSQIITKAYF